MNLGDGARKVRDIRVTQHRNKQCVVWMLRDLLLLVLRIPGWTGSGVPWRGHHISTIESESAV
jgi:hypothetical protein